MRKTATWMQQLDERILEHLQDDDWSSPIVMVSLSEFQHLGASKARIRERCRVLASAELIAPIHGDMYELTTWGRLYLDGELDAAHQPRRTARMFRGL